MRLWPFFLLPAGYLLGWFVFGLAPLPLFALLLGLMLAFAWAEGSRRGMADFAVLLGVLVGLPALLGGLSAGLVALLSPGNAEVPYVILPVAAVVVVIGLLVLTPLMFWLRRHERTLQTPLAPWLLLAGVLVFGFFPAVRVDCRELQSDDFLSFESDFQSYGQKPRWLKHPEGLPDRSELPAAFKLEQVRAGVVGCQRRVFSFDRIRPLLLVHLTDKVQPGMTTYAAAFTLGDHRKLTRWVRIEQSPFDLDLRAESSAYRGLGWDVSPAYLAFPPEVAALLNREALDEQSR